MVPPTPAECVCLIGSHFQANCPATACCPGIPSSRPFFLWSRHSTGPEGCRARRFSFRLAVIHRYAVSNAAAVFRYAQRLSESLTQRLYGPCHPSSKEGQGFIFQAESIVSHSDLAARRRRRPTNGAREEDRRECEVFARLYRRTSHF